MRRRFATLDVFTDRRFADEPGKRLADFLARMTADRERHERR
jgi:hypothetical protein